jgi:PTH1 family peptidyl-tRNA hydrolase
LFVQGVTYTKKDAPLINYLFGRKTTNDTDPGSQAFLIVGLGNPGREYRSTRHNIGFLVIDRLAQDLQCSLSKVQNKAIVGMCKLGDSKVILAKPQTFMNLSGMSVSSLIRFYKIGQIRIRPGGGSAGQKGVESIIQQLGTKEFSRMRMGIGQPPGRMDSADYVLQSFSKDEEEVLIEFQDRGVKASKSFITDGLDTAMNRFNPKI